MSKLSMNTLFAKTQSVSTWLKGRVTARRKNCSPTDMGRPGMDPSSSYLPLLSSSRIYSCRVPISFPLSSFVWVTFGLIRVVTNVVSWPKTLKIEQIEYMRSRKVVWVSGFIDFDLVALMFDTFD
jgi:hypothetical protein